MKRDCLLEPSGHSARMVFMEQHVNKTQHSSKRILTCLNVGNSSLGTWSSSLASHGKSSAGWNLLEVLWLQDLLRPRVLSDPSSKFVFSCHFHLCLCAERILETCFLQFVLACLCWKPCLWPELFDRGIVFKRAMYNDKLF